MTDSFVVIDAHVQKFKAVETSQVTGEHRMLVRVLEKVSLRGSRTPIRTSGLFSRQSDAHVRLLFQRHRDR
jgi:hypothetical protein